MPWRTRLSVCLSLLVMSSGVVLGAQSLSQQVLQLLARINTWTAKNTFLDLRIIQGVPSDTALRFYADGASPPNLYWNGIQVASGAGGVTPHNLLSTTHSDTLTGSPVRGAVVIANLTPKWSSLALCTTGFYVGSDGTDTVCRSDAGAFTNIPAAQLAGTAAAINGAAITALNASNLGSGTVPLARLSGIAFAQWASNGCVNGDTAGYNGTTWVCTPNESFTGTVTSVALTAPGIFAVAGTPVTTAGTLAVTLATQVKNLVWAGPATGADATPTFRALVTADFPLSGVAAGTYAKVTVDTSGRVTAATAQASLTADVSGVLPMANGGTGVGVSADDSVLVGSGVAWVAQTLPNCPSPSALGYTQATNLFNCVVTGGPTHSILSATHTDSLAAAVVRGDMIVGNSTPAWARSAIGTAGQIWTSNATDPSWSNTLARGTVVTSQPWAHTQTWNDGSVTFAAWTLNVTSTASAAASLLLDLQTGGTSQFKVDKSGNATALTSYVSALFQSSAAKVLFKGTGTGATQIAAAQTTPPTCSANCGTTVPAVVGTDTFMTVTMGSGGVPASGWVVTFNGTWAAAPACTVNMGLTGMVVGKIPVTVVTTTTTITVVTNGTNPSVNDVYHIHCGGTQ